MAININEVYLTVNGILNKFQSKAISPDEFNAFCRLVNFEYLKTKVGLPETYKAGFPVPPQAWQITQPITDELFQLHVKASITKGSTGYFAIPADYAAFSGCWIDYIVNQPNANPTFEKRFVEIVPETTLRTRLWNSIIPPSIEKPVGSYYAMGIEVYPLSVTKIDFSYLRYPASPNWNFDLINDVEVYNPTGSIDFEYPDIVFGDIVCRVCELYGINLRSQEVVQYSQQRKLLGQ